MPTEIPTLAEVGGVAAAPALGAESVATPERTFSVKRIAGRSVKSVVTSPFSQAITSSLSVLPSVIVNEWLDGTLELITLEVGEDAVAVAPQLQHDLDSVIARRDRTNEDWDVFLVRERLSSASSCLLY